MKRLLVIIILVILKSNSFSQTSNNPIFLFDFDSTKIHVSYSEMKKLSGKKDPDMNSYEFLTTQKDTIQVKDDDTLYVDLQNILLKAILQRKANIVFLNKPVLFYKSTKAKFKTENFKGYHFIDTSINKIFFTHIISWRISQPAW